MFFKVSSVVFFLLLFKSINSFIEELTRSVPSLSPLNADEILEPATETPVPPINPWRKVSSASCVVKEFKPSMTASSLLKPLAKAVLIFSTANWAYSVKPSPEPTAAKYAIFL